MIRLRCAFSWPGSKTNFGAVAFSATSRSAIEFAPKPRRTAAPSPNAGQTFPAESWNRAAGRPHTSGVLSSGCAWTSSDNSHANWMGSNPCTALNQGAA